MNGKTYASVVGYSLYEIAAEDGEVRNTKTGLVLKPGRSSNGYLTVSLYKDGRQRSHCIQYLLLEAHVGPRPEGLWALHADDVPDHNTIGNLYWGTRSQNGYDRVSNGHDHNANKTHCKRKHEFTPENTQWIKSRNGMGRRCRACRKIRGD